MKWQVEIVVSLGTLLYPQGQNYFVDPNCGWSATGCLPDVNNTGFVRSADALFDAIFGQSGGVCSKSKTLNGQCSVQIPEVYFYNGWNSYKYINKPLVDRDQGIGGVTTCLCSLLNSIIPIRQNSDPSVPLSNTNCPVIDFCCALRHFSFGMRDLLKFQIRLIATFFQRWEYVSGIPYPAATFNFYFCNEFQTPRPRGCGVLNPAIQQFIAIMNECFCEYFQLVDLLMQQGGFQGFRCFCGTNEGAFCNSGQVLYIVITQLIMLTRRFSDVSFWQPCGEGLPGGPNYIITCTWSYNFFRPFLQSTCTITGNLACFINALYNVCNYQVRMVLQSAFIYSINIFITFLGVVEGFLAMFSRHGCEWNPVGNPGAMYGGLNPQCAGAAILQLVGQFINMWIADGNIACRVGGEGQECDCWKEVLPNNVYVFVDTAASKTTGTGLFQGRPAQRCVLSNYASPGLTSTWFGTCCNGTAVPGTSCTSYNATHIAPWCLPQCPKIPYPCTDVYPGLPTCDSGTVGQIFVDGLAMAFFRLVRCGIFQLVPGGGGQGLPYKAVSAWDAAIIMTSLAWQASLVLVSWGYSLIAWLISYILISIIITAIQYTLGIIGFFCVTCLPVIAIIEPVVNVIAYIWNIGAIFLTLVAALLSSQLITTNSEIINSTFIPTLGRAQIPTAAPHAHDWQQWWNSGHRVTRVNKRFDLITTAKNPQLANWNSFVRFMTENIVNITNDDYPVALVVTDAMFGYYTDDCLSDLRSCVCRNLNMTGLCDWNNETDSVSPADVTDAQVRAYLAQQKFQGTSESCVLLSQKAASEMLNTAENILYVDCVKQLIMGERLHVAVPAIPADAILQGWTSLPRIMYGLYEWLQDVHVKQDERVKRAIPLDFDKDPELSMEQHVKDLAAFREQLRSHSRAARQRSLVPGTPEPLTCFEREHLTWNPLYEQVSVIEYKWRSGYMTRLMKRVAMNYRAMKEDFASTTVVPIDILDVSSRHAAKLGQALRRFPDLVKIWVEGTMSLVTTLHDEGLSSLVKTAWVRHSELRAQASRLPVPEDIAQTRSETWERFQQTPVYRWYLGESASPFPTTIVSPQMSEHLSRLYRERKEHASEHPEDTSSIFNGYGIPQHFRRIFEHLYQRYVSRFNIETDALHRVKRVYYQVYDTLYPGQLTEDQHKRFILDDNCPIVKRSVDLAVNVVQRCAAKASNQTQNFANNSLRDQVMRNVMQATGKYMPELLKDMRRTPRDVEDHSLVDSIYPPDKYEWKTWSEVVGSPARPGNLEWRRPRRILNRDVRRDQVWRNMTHKHHFRPRTALQSFNLVNWFLNAFDSIFSTNVAGNLATFFYDLQAFVLNNSTDPADFPNFGLKGWVNFIVECDFDTNLDCSLGIGLEAALGYVGLGFIIAFIAIPLIFPSILTILASTTLFIFFLILVGIIGFGWSPRCALLTPVFIFGYRVAFWIFPITIAFPECLVDEVLNLLDKYITTCYAFLLPSYMINGPVCPRCDLRIDFVSCIDTVGMGDGLSNFLYLGYNLIGVPFCNVANTFATSILGKWIPGLPTYVLGKCDMFIQATNTQKDRLNWCFWSTLPILVLPLTITVIGATFVAFILPAIFDVIIATFYLILASPLSIIWGNPAWMPSGGMGAVNRRDDEEEDGDDDDDGEDDDGDNDILTRVPAPQQNVFGGVARLLKRYVIVPIARREHAKLKRE